MKELWALLLCAFTAFFLVQGGNFEDYWGIRDEESEEVSAYLNGDKSIQICEEDQVYKVEYLLKTHVLYHTLLECFCSGDFHRKVEIKNYTTNSYLNTIRHKCGSRRSPVRKPVCTEKRKKCGEAAYLPYGLGYTGRYLDQYSKYCSCPNIIGRPRQYCRKSEIIGSTEIFRCQPLNFVYFTDMGKGFYTYKEVGLALGFIACDIFMIAI